MSMESSAKDLIGKVYPTRKYAIFVHEGTRPHKIYPSTKQALFWRGAAHPVRSVNHPGNTANRFLPRMLDKATPAIERHFVDAADKINQQIANI
jgi:hypothetical protein